MFLDYETISWNMRVLLPAVFTNVRTMYEVDLRGFEPLTPSLPAMCSKPTEPQALTYILDSAGVEPAIFSMRMRCSSQTEL